MIGEQNLNRKSSSNILRGFTITFQTEEPYFLQGRYLTLVSILLKECTVLVYSHSHFKTLILPNLSNFFPVNHMHTLVRRPFSNKTTSCFIEMVAHILHKPLDLHVISMNNSQNKMNKSHTT